MKQVLEADYNEEMVIRAAQAGDREAFASLYEAHVDRVYHYLLRRMGQPADAAGQSRLIIFLKFV